MDDSLRDLFPDFLEESTDILVRVNESVKSFPTLAEGAPKEESISEMFRGIHTIKGGCALLNLNEMKEYVHKVENQLGAYRGKSAELTPAGLASIQKCVDKIEEWLKAETAHIQGGNENAVKEAGLNTDLPSEFAASAPAVEAAVAPVVAAPLPVEEVAVTPIPVTPVVAPPVAAAHTPAASSDVLRVPLHLVSSALNNIWEVFLVRNQLGYLFEQSKPYFRERLDLLQSWENLDSALKRHVSELEGSLMSMRMTSVKGLFSRMEKAIRVYSDSHRQKVIHFKTEGESTELDKKVSDMLGEPLIHLIRNAMDHGIESAEERRALGKPEQGTVTLSAEARADRVLVIVQDDGKGIDAAKLIEKAAAKGLDVTPYTSGGSPLDIIFLPGFSTADKVTDVSGRGVGMDVVRHSIQELSGSIQIETEVGRGTKFTISLPLSLSVIFATLFKVGPEIFGSNINALVEICRIPASEVKTTDGEQYFFFREKFLPVYDLRDYLLGKKGFGNTHNLLEDEEITIFVLEVRGELVAARVGAVLQNAEVVVKPLPGLMPRLSFVQGMSILPTGQGVFVLALDKVMEVILSGRLKPWRKAGEKQSEQVA